MAKVASVHSRVTSPRKWRRGWKSPICCFRPGRVGPVLLGGWDTGAGSLVLHRQYQLPGGGCFVPRGGTGITGAKLGLARRIPLGGILGQPWGNALQGSGVGLSRGERFRVVSLAWQPSSCGALEPGTALGLTWLDASLALHVLAPKRRDICSGRSMPAAMTQSTNQAQDQGGHKGLICSFVITPSLAQGNDC